MITAPAALAECPFTVRRAREFGLTPDQLTALVRRGRLRRLFRGVYVDARCRLAERDLRCDAARLVLPAGAVAGLASAAWLQEVSVPTAGDDFEALVPSGRDIASRPGLRVRQAPLPAYDIIRVAGVPLTAGPRTALDLARLRPRVEAVVAVDQLLHADLCTLGELAVRLDGMAGWRGVRQAREVCRIAEPLAESPMETRTRLVLVDGGLPRPAAQWVVRCADLLARLDLAWPRWKVAVEYDGEVAHAARRAADRRRDRRLRDAGWTVLRYTAADVYRTPHHVVDEVRAALIDRGWRP